MDHPPGDGRQEGWLGGLQPRDGPRDVGEVAGRVLAQEGVGGHGGLLDQPIQTEGATHGRGGGAATTARGLEASQVVPTPGSMFEQVGSLGPHRGGVPPSCAVVRSR